MRSPFGGLWVTAQAYRFGILVRLYSLVDVMPLAGAFPRAAALAGAIRGAGLFLFPLRLLVRMPVQLAQKLWSQ